VSATNQVVCKDPEIGDISQLEKSKGGKKSVRATKNVFRLSHYRELGAKISGVQTRGFRALCGGIGNGSGVREEASGTWWSKQSKVVVRNGGGVWGLK